MQQCTYEFEVFQSEGWWLAVPYDLAGGTQGKTLAELHTMVADWLRLQIEHAEIHGLELPVPSFGNKPRYGGQNVTFSVVAGIETVEKVSASEAARLLGVSPSRVSQMLESRKLEGWREGRNTYVTVDSVSARLSEAPKAGRPKKEQALAMA